MYCRWKNSKIGTTSSNPARNMSLRPRITVLANLLGRKALRSCCPTAHWVLPLSQGLTLWGTVSPAIVSRTHCLRNSLESYRPESLTCDSWSSRTGIHAEECGCVQCVLLLYAHENENVSCLFSVGLVNRTALIRSRSENQSCSTLRCSVKVKASLFLYLINYVLHHENIWGSGGTAPPFLISALYGGE
jgi:hypothetical protein